MSLRDEIHASLPLRKRLADTVSLGALSRGTAQEIGELRLRELEWRELYSTRLFDLSGVIQERAVAIGASPLRLGLAALFDLELPRTWTQAESQDVEGYRAYVEQFGSEAALSVAELERRAEATTRGDFDAQLRAGTLEGMIPDPTEATRPKLSAFEEGPDVPQAEHDQAPTLSR